MSSKRIEKKIMIVLCLFIVLIALVFNIHKIRFGLGMYNIYSKEKNIETLLDNDEPIDKVEVYNPLTPIIESEVDDIEIADDNIKQELTQSIEAVGDKVTLASKWPDQDMVDKNNIKPYVTIVKEYNVKLENLRATFEIKLENLIHSGIAEYNGGQVAKAKLMNKYLNAGAQLEKTSDSQFNGLIKEMEEVLKINKHDTKVVREVKDYYTSFKNAKKQEVISKGMRYLK